MKIRTKFILPITAIVIGFALVALVAFNLTVKGLVTEQKSSLLTYAQENLSGEAENRKKSIYVSIEAAGKRALEQASFFSRLPEVQEIYRLALTGNIDDEADPVVQQARQQLRKVMKPYVNGYKAQTGAKEFKIHFHLPNSRSLARIWREGWQTKRDGKKLDVSDSLTSFRNTVVEINQGSHKPLTGIEVGRGGFALRGLSAITGPSGEHLGSCEVLLPFSDVLKANHLNDNFQIAVYMLSDLLQIATKLQDPKKNPILDGKYVFTSSTNAKLTNSILTSAILDAGKSNESQKVVGKQFLSSFPIPDYSGKVAGVMALAYDISQLANLEDQMNQAAGTTINNVNWRFGGGGLVMLIAVILTIYLITRVLTGPLQLAVRSAEKVAVGDLSESMHHDSKDEIGALAQAINQMIDSLKRKTSEAEQIAAGNLQTRVAIASDQDSMGHAFQSMANNLNEVLGEVARASDQIDSGSQQVSDSAQHLSQGATESAASLEEISSSLNEISSQTQHSAENADQANELAKGAQDAARTGSERMTAMVSAMSEINESGQNISKIIKVIDEIAFQTNLLALNAAVEAARAGQHGKGFAVVAEEVRNLAARSAKAAEETAHLIEGSVEKAGNGTQIAQRTSEALGEIVGSITKVTDLVAEIAAASNEQAEGLNQVNQGLGQIDQAVQQNTATAEESAASAEELSSQATHLKHMLSRFTLANQPPVSVPAPEPQAAPRQVVPSPPQPAESIGWADMESKTAQPNIKLDDEEFGKF